MKTSSTMTSVIPGRPVGKGWEEVSASFDRFCLAAGIETLGAMMEADAEVVCGPRHSRSEDWRSHRWGRVPALNSDRDLASIPMARGEVCARGGRDPPISTDHRLRVKQGRDQC